MNIIAKILNLFPRYLGKESNNLNVTFTLILAILSICLFFIISGIHNIEPKMALMIDSVHLPVRNGITVGEGSMVSYRGIPSDYIRFNPEEDGTFSWQIDSVRYQDSLMYFKVNDDNPQKYDILNDPRQVVHLHFPDGPDVSITGQEIWNEWLSFKDQKDILLRHFAVRYGIHHIAETDSARIIWKNYIDDEGIRSFLEHTSSSIKIVILDRHTRIEQNDGHFDSYRYRGRTKLNPENKGRCKIQFFRVSSYCYNEGEESSDWFQIDTINYVMKPTVCLTGWGAGHVMLDASPSQGVDLHFPKGLGFVGTLDSLKSISKAAGHMITIKQQGLTIPTRTDIYLPQLSSSIPQDLCSIELNDSTIQIRDNNNNISQVTSRRLRGLPIPVLPLFNKQILTSGNAQLNCRVGIIDFGFASAYLVLPAIVALLLIFLTLFKGCCLRFNWDANSISNPFYCPSQLGSYPMYMALLILIGMLFAFCRSLIALKLSYTYPYFEKLTAIIPVSCSLFLLLFFTFVMVINTHVVGSNDFKGDNLGVVNGQRHSWRKWFAWGSTVGILAALAYVLFGILDQNVSSGILSSYYDSDIYSYNFLKWTDKFGINDNHRSVPYTQILIEIVLLFIWFIQNLYWQFVRGGNIIDKYSLGWANKPMQKIRDIVNPFFRKIHNAVTSRIRKKDSGISKRQKWMIFIEEKCIYGMILAVTLVFISLVFPYFKILLRFVSIVIAIACLWNALKLALKNLWPWHYLVLLLLAAGGSMLGNYGTAFITLIVITGLSRSLTNITFLPSVGNSKVDNRHSVFFEMIIISTIYIACSMIADNGYVTNYIGLLTAVICFYYLYDRNTTFGAYDNHNINEESKWTWAVAIFAVFFAILLPVMCSYMFDPGKVNYSRISRRMLLYSDFERQQISGFRYSESDTEFMAIMSHYLQMENNRHQCDDPLCNEGHFLHPSVSTGQSPVVLNDLSVPVAFIGGYGVKRASIIIFLLNLSLLILVIRFSLAYANEERGPNRSPSYLTYAMQWRLLALFMWVGTTFYIYMSYIGFIPFTGRLIPGFGVDSVGEALESAFLLAFMAAVTLRAKDKTDPTPE